MERERKLKRKWKNAKLDFNDTNANKKMTITDAAGYSWCQVDTSSIRISRSFEHRLFHIPFTRTCYSSEIEPEEKSFMIQNWMPTSFFVFRCLSDYSSNLSSLRIQMMLAKLHCSTFRCFHHVVQIITNDIHNFNRIEVFLSTIDKDIILDCSNSTRTKTH